MTGTLGHERFWIPREHLQVEHFARTTGKQHVVQLLFPNWHRWASEIQSLLGDKSDAAYNFVYRTMPFLAETMIQDGIFWIRDYPNHTVSLRLLSVMPAYYANWAMLARKKVSQEERK